MLSSRDNLLKKMSNNFAIAAQDKHPAHISEDNAKTFYKSGVVYGIFSSSLFSVIVRDLFPGAIYLGQTLKFTSPIMINDTVQAKMMIQEINETKKKVTFRTTVTKTSEDGKVAIEGEGTFILPQLKVSSTFT